MSTPIYGLPFPVLADPIFKGPGNVRETLQALAEAVETALVGAGGAGGFTHNQATPAATWTIANPLGRYPAAVLIVVGTELVDTDVEFPDLATIVVTFSAPQSGRAEII